VDDNVDATQAWNGPLFAIWTRYRDIVAEGLHQHGEAVPAACPPHEGDRVLDIGCGLGDTTVRLAGLVGATGHAHGVDVVAPMVATARVEAADAGMENISFATCDVQATTFDGTFDYAFSRMGTMFFANPVVALGKGRRALVPGRRLNMVVWRRKVDNPFMHRAELVVAEYLEEPEECDAPRCGPGRSRWRTRTPSRTCCGTPARSPSASLARICRTRSATTSTTPSLSTSGPRRGAAHVGRPGGRHQAEDRG
jgi:SAM-dependent methyltransferase